MSLRMLLCRIRPSLCWIGLFPLHFRHLSKRMLFAGGRKQEDAERKSDDALANERSHNTLAQLSVSRRAGKDKARRWHRHLACGVRGLPGCRRFATKRSGETPERPTGKMPVLLLIERRLHGVTITRGGPHRKTQRVERSVRSRSAFCRHATVFRADFLYAEGYTVLVLV